MLELSTQNCGIASCERDLAATEGPKIFIFLFKIVTPSCKQP